MFKILKRLAKSKGGATAVEYGLIAAIVSMAAVGALNSIGVSLITVYDFVSESVDEPVNNFNAKN